MHAPIKAGSRGTHKRFESWPGSKRRNWSRVASEDLSEDKRVGLNLTYRTLAAVLKYDNCIPLRRSESPLVKGYYLSEEGLVKRIKEHVVGPDIADGMEGGFKTIECQIMDVADDIAYSTYDLEDALKTGFVSPMSMIWALSSETHHRGD